MTQKLTTIHDLTRNQIIAEDLMTLIPAWLSFLSGLLSIYWYNRMHHSKRVFRHKLYLYLMGSNIVRSLVHILFPIFTLHALSINNFNSLFFSDKPFPACDFFGYMLNTSFLSSDFIIAMTSLHTVIIIFNPQSNSKFYKIPKIKVNSFKTSLKHFILPNNHQTSDLNELERTLMINNNGYFETNSFIYKQEAGLYRYNLPIFLLLVLGTPIVLSSLVFAGGHHMKNYLSFCFPPAEPFWIRIVTEWGPRLIVVLFIVGCYFSIYIYIYRKLRIVTLEHDNLLKNKASAGNGNGIGENNISVHNDNFFKKCLFLLKDIFMGIYFAIFNSNIEDGNSFMNSLTSSDVKHSKEQKEEDFEYRDVYVVKTSNDDTKEVYNGDNSHNNNNNNMIDIELNNLNQTQHELSMQIFMKSLEEFKARKQQSLKSLRSIFIYPASYVLIWLLPLVVQVLRFCKKDVPVVLLCFVGFCQAIDGFVQTLIFAYREKPWRVFKGKIEPDLINTLDDLNPGDNNNNRKESSTPLHDFKLFINGGNEHQQTPSTAAHRLNKELFWTGEDDDDDDDENILYKEGNSAMGGHKLNDNHESGNDTGSGTGNSMDLMAMLNNGGL